MTHRCTHLLFILLVLASTLVSPVRAEESHVLIHVDQPGEGSTIAEDARLTGWAVDTAASASAGLDTLHVYVDGPAGQGRFLGSSVFLERPDVASAFARPDWARSGFAVPLSGLPPGPHTLFVYAFNSRTSDRPVQTISLVVAARRFPLVEAPRSDVGAWCVDQNPACGRDPWWLERNELQRDDLVEYRFAPGLVTEYRFVEAVSLVWQWPEGRSLLTGAGEHGVRIVSTTRASERICELQPAGAPDSGESHLRRVSFVDDRGHARPRADARGR